ncbi:ATP-binding protein [Acinetobacter rudis]|uniref:ATP-binding protein n=1 Tax=Acinetobacter rudis TaxID=632955 RepID=UPI00334269B2
MIKHNSLKKRLILFLAIFNLLLGGVLLTAAYRIALHEINEILDAQMSYVGERIATNVRPLQSVFDPHKDYHEEDLFIDIWAYKDQSDIKHNQHLLVGRKDQKGFYSHHNENGDWIVYVYPTQYYQIQISQQLKVRKVLAMELAAGMIFPYVLIFPFALLGLIWIIRHSFKPLDQFKFELAQRSSQDLSPIDLDSYPNELAPTIREMNQLFQRISLTQQEQKQFIADAAHELRTPITALNLQTKILLSESPEDRNLKNLSMGLARIKHLVTQLLALAKQDATVNLKEYYCQLSLNEITVQCIEQLMNFAVEKEIDMGFLTNEVVEMNSIEHSLHSIIYNLLDNAIKYSPRGGVINVSIDRPNQQYVRLTIEDSGAGLEPEQYEQVLKRFYRVNHHLEVGSGLGLSIVDRAIQQLEGEIQFSRSHDLGGLSVVVILPTNTTQSVEQSS